MVNVTPSLLVKLSSLGLTVWQAQAGGKHKFLTADNLLKRGWQCNPICSSCNQANESAQHLIIQCSFAMDVWTRASAWTEGMVQVPEQHLNIEDWWNLSVVSNDKKVRKVKAALLIYVAWNL
jgi:hypothetical protein